MCFMKQLYTSQFQSGVGSYDDDDDDDDDDDVR